MDNERAVDVLSSLEQELADANYDKNVGNPRMPRLLSLVRLILPMISKSPIYNQRVLDIINNEIADNLKELSDILHGSNEHYDTDFHNRLSILALGLEIQLVRCRDLLMANSEKDNLNSADFYQKRLSELEDNIKKLESEKEKNTQKAKQRDEEITRLSFVIKEAQKQLEEKKRQEDAQNNWNDKIEKAFHNLNEYQKPLLKEKTRLAVLFWVFGILAFLSLCLVCIAIYMAVHKIYFADAGATLSSYLPYFSPIPIIGVMLWVFIVQMNREQRQLIMLTQHLHNLSYTEGLLKSITIFDPKIEDAVSRINATIDKLLDNHLSIHPALILKEDSLSRGEKNQSSSIKEMASLLKEIRELVK